MWKSPVRLLAVGMLVSVGALVSACGGPATPGVASLGTTTTTAAPGQGTTAGTKQQLAVKFAKCMRSHGVKDFPESNSTGAVQISAGSGIDPNSPTFQAATKACRSLIPKPSAAQVRQVEQNALKLSKCMRAHGVTNFPDPQFSTGGGSIKISAGGGGLNPTSPAFQRASEACSKYLHLPKGAKGAPGNAQEVRLP
jgi:hypothetical protein